MFVCLYCKFNLYLLNYRFLKLGINTPKMVDAKRTITIGTKILWPFQYGGRLATAKLSVYRLHI